MELKLDKSTWKPVTFGDVVQEVRTTIKDPKGEGIERVVGLEHIETENIHLSKWASIEEDTTFTKGFKKGHVLFGRRRAYLKKAAQAGFDGICSGDITVMEAKDELLPELLPFLVCNDKFFDYAVKHSAGGLSPRTKFKDLANYEFLIPPKDQQAKLAELLWAADEVVESHLLALQKVESLTHSYRSEVFGRSTWPRKKLKDLFSVQLGKMLSPKAKQGINSFPYLANANVQWDTFSLEKVNEMDFSEKDQEKFSLKNGDLLVCEGGDVGRSAIWRGEITPCYYQKALHRLRPLTDLSSEVMLQFMIWAKSAGVFTGHTGHSTIAHLTAVMLKELNVPVPPKNEIGKIEDQFATFKNSTVASHEALCQSSNLLKSLINQIFSEL